MILSSGQHWKLLQGRSKCIILSHRNGENWVETHFWTFLLHRCLISSTLCFSSFRTSSTNQPSLAPSVILHFRHTCRNIHTEHMHLLNKKQDSQVQGSPLLCCISTVMAKNMVLWVSFVHPPTETWQSKCMFWMVCGCYSWKP